MSFLKLVLFVFLFLFLRTFKLSLKNLSTVNIICGLPGSGKSTAVAAYTHIFTTKRKFKKLGYRVFSNLPVHGALPYSWKDDYGVLDMSNGLILMDEAGVEVDNRQFKTNFTPARVEYLKLLRHRGNIMMIFSQTWSDMDLKLRDMAGQVWICQRSILPFVTCLVPVSKKIGVDEETHQMLDMYYLKHPIRRFFATQRIFRPLYYRYFDSFAAPKLAEYPADRKAYDLLSERKTVRKRLSAWLEEFRNRKGSRATDEPVILGKDEVKTVVHEDSLRIKVHKYNPSCINKTQSSRNADLAHTSESEK